MAIRSIRTAPIFTDVWIGLLLACFGVAVAAADTIDEICFEDMPETKQQCLALIDQLENSKGQSNDDLIRLGRALVGLSATTQVESEKGEFRDRATNAFEVVLARDPENYKAKFELALLSPRDKKVRLLQEIVESRPDFVPAVRSLTRFLLRFGTADEFAQLTTILENSYTNVEQAHKLYVATLVYQAYIASDNNEGARNFRARVVSEHIEELVPTSLSTAERQLGFVCDYLAFVLALEESCLNHIRKILSAGVSQKENAESALVMEAITSVLTHRHKLQATHPDIQIELRDMLEDMKDAGADNLDFYLAYAIVLSGNRRVEVLRRATETEGLPRGKAAYWLGESLVEVGNIKSAIEVFQEISEEGIPPYAMLAATEKLRLGAN